MALLSGAAGRGSCTAGLRNALTQQMLLRSHAYVCGVMVGGELGLSFPIPARVLHPRHSQCSLMRPSLPVHSFQHPQQAERGLWATQKSHVLPCKALKDLKNSAGSVGWVTLGAQQRVGHNMAQSRSFNSESRDTAPGVMCHRCLPPRKAAELQAGAFFDAETASGDDPGEGRSTHGSDSQLNPTIPPGMDHSHHKQNFFIWSYLGKWDEISPQPDNPSYNK